MELDAADVVVAVTERHDLTFVAEGGYLEAIGEVVSGDNPGVVASHGETIVAVGRAFKDGVGVGMGDCALCGDSVENIGKVLKTSTKDLADGLMPQTNAENGLATSVGADDFKQKACLRRDARARTEYNLVERFQLRKLKLVVTKDSDVGSQFLQQMGEVVGERVVVVDDDNMGI